MLNIMRLILVGWWWWCFVCVCVCVCVWEREVHENRRFYCVLSPEILSCLISTIQSKELRVFYLCLLFQEFP